jgi:hypothetical protein
VPDDLVAVEQHALRAAVSFVVRFAWVVGALESVERLVQPIRRRFFRRRSELAFVRLERRLGRTRVAVPAAGFRLERRQPVAIPAGIVE